MWLVVGTDYSRMFRILLNSAGNILSFYLLRMVYAITYLLFCMEDFVVGVDFCSFCEGGEYIY